jgi:site-specific recombinase XerD
LASVRFYIEKRRDAQGRVRTINVPILLFFSFDGKRIQVNTGERINAGDWDPERQEVRSNVKGAKILNKYLISLAEDFQEIYREARTLGIQPGKEYILKEFRHRRRKTGIDFFDVIMRFINENHESWSIHTFRKMRTTYNHLRSFSEAEELEINFSRIDKEFLDRYAKFFRIKYNHTNSTIAKNLDVLKWFLNWATSRGYNKNLAFRDYQLDWQTGNRVPENARVLDWDELMKLSAHQPASKNLKIVRDVFCLMCFTGLKLSRIYEIQAGNVFEDRILMPGSEGSEPISFPINKRAHQILEHYTSDPQPDGSCFKMYHNSYFNRLLKTLGREAGLNRFVQLQIHSGREKGIRQVPKYEIITSKIAVNTFIYNGLRLGISAEVIAYITDQKTYSAIDRIRPILEGEASRDIRKFDILDS